MNRLALLAWLYDVEKQDAVNSMANAEARVEAKAKKKAIQKANRFEDLLYPSHWTREWATTVIQNAPRMNYFLRRAFEEGVPFAVLFKAKWQVLEQRAWELQGRQEDAARNRVFGRSDNARSRSIVEGRLESPQMLNEYALEQKERIERAIEKQKGLTGRAAYLAARKQKNWERKHKK